MYKHARRTTDCRHPPRREWEMLFSSEQIRRAIQGRQQAGLEWRRLTLRERQVLQYLVNELDKAGIRHA